MSGNDTKVPPLRPRRWFGLLFWAGVIAFVGWLWPRSYHTSDTLALFTRSGDVQGVMSHRGQFLLAISNLSLGPDRALSAEHVAVPVDEGDWLFDGAYTGAGTTDGKWGFGYAVSNKGDLPDADATWSAVVFPHWAAVALFSVVLLWHLWRFVLRTRERRWHRQGRCSECGYDLRGTPSDRCPECGSVVIAKVGTTREAGIAAGTETGAERPVEMPA